MNNRILQEYQKTKEEVRLNKYLSESGVCSRREADRLIEAGRVMVDGEVAVMGDENFSRTGSDGGWESDHTGGGNDCVGGQ